MCITKADLSPMLATLIKAPFDDPEWVFERKWDGFRVIARIGRGKAALYSRRGKDITARYPRIVSQLRTIPTDAVIDGELVALDSRGRPNFQLLQNAGRRRVRLRYYAFDLLFHDGADIRRFPLLKRKELLKKLLPKRASIRFSEHVVGTGKKYFASAVALGLEGVVAKRADSRYRSNTRSRDWLKIKNVRRQEAVIVGYTKPRRSRTHLGSLILAVWTGTNWAYAGNAGTGFTRDTLTQLYRTLRPLRVTRSPFSSKTPYDRTATWVKPVTVCEVKFTEWTAAGEMRHPVFMGLRDDKKPKEVQREIERTL